MGIYTWFDETNLRRGQAMIIGPAKTPYADCPLFFSLEIPIDYPLVPPKVFIMTTDNSTRLHPNLYTGGKVCLSILGTYSGPSWVSTMNIETVLKSILSLLTDNPITNEPGWERLTLADSGAKNYAEYVQYALAKLTIQQYKTFKAQGGHPLWDPFRDSILGTWEQTHLPQLQTMITERAAVAPLQQFPSLVYAMSKRMANWAELQATAKN